MRKLVESTFVTLDGVIGDPQVWGMSYWDAEHNEYARRLLFSADALLLGRKTYEGFAAAWPTMTDEVGFADKMNTMAKYVVSSTLRELTWNNSSLVEGDVAEGVAKLKEQAGGDILVAGSATLVRTLLEHDLVDELRLMVYPILLGSGKRLFGDSASGKAFRLLELRAVGDDGVVILRYEPVRA